MVPLLTNVRTSALHAFPFPQMQTKAPSHCRRCCAGLLWLGVPPVQVTRLHYRHYPTYARLNQAKGKDLRSVKNPRKTKPA